MKKVWGGRFQGTMHPRMETFTDSYAVDRNLMLLDFYGTLAQVEHLKDAGILTVKQAARLEKVVREGIRRTALGWTPPGRFEDVHSAVEHWITKRLPDLGPKLHTGRSRNDQVALDLRLWIKWAVTEELEACATFLEHLGDLANAHATTVLPGYTHLQRAVPITLGHWAAAYGEMLNRDADRFWCCAIRADASPLGSGALAGASFAFDRKKSAKRLGFAKPTENSLDAVSDRDAALDFLAACVNLQVHLSRLAEDLILWNTQEFGFVELPDAFATGSSLMPHKKNPDVFELIRGRAAVVLGNYTALAALLKALPSAYNRDLQEDKALVFRAFEMTLGSLKILDSLWPHLQWRPERMREAVLEDGLSAATDLADHLVLRGVPFRQAHAQVGRAVRRALELGVSLMDLPEKEIRRLMPKAEPEWLSKWTPEASILQKKVLGGVAPAEVRRSSKKLQTVAKEWRRKAVRLQVFTTEMEK